jgi:hypothetical protein
LNGESRAQSPAHRIVRQEDLGNDNAVNPDLATGDVTVLAEALAQAELGRVVVPVCRKPCTVPAHHKDKDGEPKECDSPGKTATVYWADRDSSTEAEIRQWWQTWPDANLAILTGHRSRLIVVDIDGPEGEASLKAMEDAYGPLPPTLEVKTKHGRHLFFNDPNGEVVNRAGSNSRPFEHDRELKIPGLDVRGEGGLVVVPPSQDREYANDLDQVDIAAGWVKPISTSNAGLDGTAEAEVDLGEARSWLTDGEPCQAMAKILTEYTGHRADVRRLQVKILRHGEQGHQGGLAAWNELRDLYGNDDEWSKLASSAPGQIKDRTAEADKGCCGEVKPAKALAQLLTERKAPVEEQEAQRKVFADHFAAKAKEPPKPDPTIHDDGRKRLLVDVSAHLSEALRNGFGAQELAGIFGRSGELVFTPRVGEDGYIPPKNKRDHDGPAQIRILTPGMIKALVQVKFACGYYKENKATKKREWFDALAPFDAVNDAWNAARLGIGADHLQPLYGTSHTPVLRQDGSVLDQPGYDKETGLLYLPDKGLSVPPVPEDPTPEQLKAAMSTVLELVADFAFVGDDHRANWLGMFFTPIMRPLLPPPYQMDVISAPNPGSGKSLLAWIMGQVHGRVMRGDLPRQAEEMGKALSSILLTTTAPIVTFDNVRGVVRSSVLEGLLTTADWSDRKLGKLEELNALRNDRLWLITSNNASLGGDLARRVLPVEVDPGVPDPHLRPATDFKLNLKTHVPAHRGEILAAMLTIARGWILDGRPLGENTRSDDYAEWTANLDGMLTWAVKFAPADHKVGTFGGATQSAIVQDSDSDEWAGFCAAIFDGMKSSDWTVKKLVQALDLGNVDPDALPDALAHKWERVAATKSDYGHTIKNKSGFSRTLGHWLANRAGRYAHGWKIERRGGNAARQEWRVVEPPKKK